MKKRFVILGFALLHVLAMPIHAATKESNIRVPSSTDLAGTIKSLRQIKVDSQSPSIPVTIRPLLTRLKHQLRDVVITVLDAQALRADNAATIHRAVLAKLNRQGVRLAAEAAPTSDFHLENGYTYGDIQEILISRPTGHTDLIAVTVTLGVVCGADTSFYLFQRQGHGWQLILAQEANDYEDISGAQGSFGYAISPPTASGEFFVVTKNVNPWCTSNWQLIRYQAMRPDISAYEPKILLKAEESIYRGGDTYGIITASPNDFTLQFSASQSLDFGIFTRDHIVAYQVQDDQVQRIPPFGHKPEDFLDEWFDLPWAEASKWVIPSGLTALNRVHAMFRADRLGKKSQFYSSFVFDPPACRVGADQWLVGIELEPLDGKTLPPETPKQIYFTIVEKGGNYFLEGVSGSSLPPCRT